MLGAVFAGALKAARGKRKRNPRGGLVKRKRRPAFLRGKKGQPLGDRSKRRRRLNPKEVSIGRIRRVNIEGKPDPRKPRRVIDKSPEARQKFLSSLTKAELEKRMHRDPRRTPGKPKQSGTTKRTPAQIALVNKYTHGDPKRTPGKPKSRVQEPSKTERVSKERPSKVQPRVRKRRKSKGPSYTSTSLNV